jgi:hypothetical protein
MKGEGLEGKKYMCKWGDLFFIFWGDEFFFWCERGISTKERRTITSKDKRG